MEKEEEGELLTLGGVAERLRVLEEKLEKLTKEYRLVQEALVKMYEDQRRRERVL